MPVCLRLRPYYTTLYTPTSLSPCRTYQSTFSVTVSLRPLSLCQYSPLYTYQSLP